MHWKQSLIWLLWMYFQQNHLFLLSLMVLLVFLLLAACPFLFCLSFSSLFACLLIFSALFGVFRWNSSNRHFLLLRWNSPRLRTTLLSESISTGLQRFGVTNLNINLPKLPSILILNRGFRVWMLLYQNSKLIQCCEGHLFCHDCIQAHANSVVAGVVRAVFTCMMDNGDETFPKNQLHLCISEKQLHRIY